MKLDINKLLQQFIIYSTLIVVVVYAYFNIVVDSTQIIDSRYGVVAKQIYMLFEGNISMLNKFSIIIYLLGGIILTKLSIIKDQYTRDNLSILIFYLIFSTSFFFTQNNIFEAITSLLVILSLDRLIKSFNSLEINLHYVFSAGVLMGITPLFIPQAIFTLPIIFVARILYKRPLNELIIYTAAYSLPVLLYSYIIWALDYPFALVYTNIYYACSVWGYGNIIDELDFIGDTPHSFVIFLIMVVISIIAIVTYNIESRSHKHLPSKHVFILFSYFGLITISTIFITTNPISLISVISIPLSVLISSLFIRYSNRFIIILYIIILLILFL